MYSAKGRYLLIAFFLLGALICLFYDQYQLAALGGLFAAYVVWSHFKHSSILAASKQFRAGNHQRAAELLAEVPNPDRLARSRRGYYEFMLGNIALKNEAYDVAEVHFQIASRFPLGGKNDKAFVLIHLANLALRKKDKDRTTAYINKAKELADTPKAREIILKLERGAAGL